MAKKNIFECEVTSVKELIEILDMCKNTEKRGGEKVWINGNTACHTNKFPYDSEGNALPRRFTNQHPELALSGEWKKQWHIELNFSADYAKKMAKVLGIEDYTPRKDDNREHLIPAVLMRYRSTANVCVIAMPTNYINDGVTRDGQPATEQDLAYLKPYIQKKNDSKVIDYLTIGVKNITSISIGGRKIKVNITDLTYEVEEEREPAYAVAQ
jgi:hypothetical protein